MHTLLKSGLEAILVSFLALLGSAAANSTAATDTALTALTTLNKLFEEVHHLLQHLHLLLLNPAAVDGAGLKRLAGTTNRVSNGLLGLKDLAIGAAGSNHCGHL
jgi:hypothetical protein